jgi:phenylalanyl-tRNA synthetase alpha chain
MIILNRFYFRPIYYHYRTNTTKIQKKSNPFNIAYDPEKQTIIYPSELILNNQHYPTDSWTNVNPHILSRIGQNLHRQKHHPIHHLVNRLRQFFYQYYDAGKLSPKFSIIDNLSPIVTTEQNFDSICTPIDHISRTKSMNYYINEKTLLRAHTSAHQVDLMRSGLNAFLCIGDVYRRDSIDPTHYPVFHQCEGVRLFNKEELFIDNRNVKGEKENLKIFGSNEHRDATKQEGHTLEAVKLVEASLKQTITNLFQILFSSTSTLNSRWIDATFPFTHPSWEYEIEINGKWYELLGCGIIDHRVLENSGLNKDYIGWAFGLGLERIAMIMYGIPDIRLFWSTDSGFLSQFAFDDSTHTVQYKPISIYPQCINDLSMWMNKIIIDPMDLYDLVRTIGGDLIEQVILIDEFYHQKKQRHSQTYRIIYRSMDRTLTKDEINLIHKDIENHCRKQFGVEIR